MNTLWIGLGGAAGSIARYHLSSFVGKQAGSAFPAGTLAVNVIGSFLIAVLFAIAARGAVSETAQLALATGVLGGFTTYSAFNQETLRLFQSGHAGIAVAYLTATLAGGLAAGFAGFILAR